MNYLVSIVYFFTALVFGGLALFQRAEVLDIALNEVFFILPQSLLWGILAVVFVIFGLISLTFEINRKSMFKFLFAIHYILTIAGIILLYYLTQKEADPNQFVDYSIYEDVRNAPESPAEPIQKITYVLYGLIGAQAIFVLNILLSFFKSRRAAKKPEPAAADQNA